MKNLTIEQIKENLEARRIKDSGHHIEIIDVSKSRIFKSAIQFSEAKTKTIYCELLNSGNSNRFKTIEIKSLNRTNATLVSDDKSRLLKFDQFHVVDFISTHKENKAIRIEDYLINIFKEIMKTRQQLVSAF